MRMSISHHLPGQVERKPQDTPSLAVRALTTPLLDILGLDVHFSGHHAVQGLDLQIAAGETVALVGESGCGKSTTALAIMRLLPASTRVKGAVRFAGADLLTLGAQELNALRGRDIAMIFQEPMTSLNPVLTIGQQVAEALTLHQPLTRATARARAIELLDLVKLPEPARRFDDYPHNLSGGQRQRVMIAMAVACRPRLLIADEPTTALDVTIQAQILALIDELRRELGMAVLLITHDLGVVAQWADRVAVMYGGRQLESGPVAHVFEQPRHAYTQGLLGASLHLSHSLHYRTSRLAEVRPDGQGGFPLVRPSMPSQNVAPLPARKPQGPLLAVESLEVGYALKQGSIQAVAGVSFEIAPGETVGLVGESGCGKSSLSRAILGLVPAQGGRVLLDGQNLLPLSPREWLPWRRRIQMIFQDPYSSLNPRQQVQDILGHALAIHGVRDRAERERRILSILDDVGLSQSARTRYPHEFSGGQRQRIGIARALVLRPELVICDEPVSALDVSIQAQILNLLADLKVVHGLSYLFISHDLSVVRYIADRVLVMNRGQIVESASHEHIWSHPRHPYTRTLLAAVPGRSDDRSPLNGQAPELRQAA